MEKKINPQTPINWVILEVDTIGNTVRVEITVDGILVETHEFKTNGKETVKLPVSPMNPLTGTSLSFTSSKDIELYDWEVKQ